MTKTSKRKSRAKPSTANDVREAERIYTTGQVARLIGVSPRTAAVTMDANPDLAYKVGKDRRIRHGCLVQMTKRMGISHHHLNWNCPLAWVGEPIAHHRDETDLCLSAVSASIKAARGEISAVCAIRHSLPWDVLNMLACIAEQLHVRMAAKLSDDVAGMAQKTRFLWLYQTTDGVDESDVMRWLRLADQERGL